MDVNYLLWIAAGFVLVNLGEILTLNFIRRGGSKGHIYWPGIFASTFGTTILIYLLAIYLGVIDWRMSPTNSIVVTVMIGLFSFALGFGVFILSVHVLAYQPVDEKPRKERRV